MVECKEDFKMEIKTVTNVKCKCPKCGNEFTEEVSNPEDLKKLGVLHHNYFEPELTSFIE